MADNHQGSLKRQSIHANKLEHFVFLPNNLTDINSVSSDISTNPIFRNAIAAKKAGNASFEKRRFAEAIRHYSRAIESFSKMDTKACAPVLSVCYENRATATAVKKKYWEAIVDASKAIELNEHNAMAYYRRAMCYFDVEKYYRALQDIMQACVLERFKNPVYIRLAIEIVVKIENDTLLDKWKIAYDEMESRALYCDGCMKQHLKFVKNCGVFDAIRVPIPENQPLTGYIRAMSGIQELNVDDIMAGCDEEIASMGLHLVHSYILKAIINSAVVQSPSNEVLRQDMERMNSIISSSNVPAQLKHQAKFCRVTLYAHKAKFLESDNDLRSLKDQYGDTALYHVIKGSALHQFVLKHRSCFESLDKCCELLPEVYELQRQTVCSKANNMSWNDRAASTSFLISSLETLVKRFPMEFDPRIRLIRIYIDQDVSKAMKMLEQVKEDFPNRFDEFVSLHCLLEPRHESYVDYFKRSIRAHPDNPDSFRGLFDYFSCSTFEYAKVIEVSTKALSHFLKRRDFKEMFVRRQLLLKKIICQNFWDKL